MPRRKQTGDPSFGSDSFLDVIANLVGIVLIIIVLVGARIRELPQLAPVASVPAVEVDTSSHEAEVSQLKSQVASLQQQVLARLRDQERLHAELTTQELARSQVRQEREVGTARVAEQERQNAAAMAAARQVEESQRPLRARLAELQQALQSIRPPAPERKLVRFHLPVSKPLGAGELLFECRAGRVTFADLQGLLEDVRRAMPSHVEQLRSRWEVAGTVGPIGAFQLKYTVARERSSSVDLAFGGLPPADQRGFAYGLSDWELVPSWEERGETVRDALAAGSRFREVIDASDPDTASLTFFIYPDSFGTYRELRDYLYERGFVVAGRPLMKGSPIAGSRQGTISRGQ